MQRHNSPHQAPPLRFRDERAKRFTFTFTLICHPGKTHKRLPVPYYTARPPPVRPSSEAQKETFFKSAAAGDGCRDSVKSNNFLKTHWRKAEQDFSEDGKMRYHFVVTNGNAPL